MTGQPAITGVVLAGGRSTRFGSDKASALFRGRPMLQMVVSALASACNDIVVVRARGQVLPPIEAPVRVQVLEDVYEAEGPLAGIATGLPGAAGDFAFIVSTDAPLLQPRLVSGLAGLAGGHDIVLPHAAGYPQPLAALYRVQMCEPAFRRAFDRGVRRIVGAFDGLDVREVPENELRDFDPDLRSFRNANTPGALAEMEALAAADGGP